MQKVASGPCRPKGRGERSARRRQAHPPVWLGLAKRKISRRVQNWQRRNQTPSPLNDRASGVFPRSSRESPGSLDQVCRRSNIVVGLAGLTLPHMPSCREGAHGARRFRSDAKTGVRSPPTGRRPPAVNCGPSVASDGRHSAGVTSGTALSQLRRASVFVHREHRTRGAHRRCLNLRSR